MSLERLAPSPNSQSNASGEGPTARLDGPMIDTICNAMSERHVSPGDALVAPDSRASTVVIRSGIAAQMHTFQDGRRQVLELLFPGEILFCEPSEVPDTCQVHAATNVTICESDCDALFDLGLQYPDIGRSLFEVMRGILRRKNRQLLDLGRKTAGERVASFLLEYEERSSGAGTPDGPIRLMVPRDIIADLLCLTRETISRCLASFRDENLIRIHRHDQVEVVDAAGLRRRANGEDLVGRA